MKLFLDYETFYDDEYSLKKLTPPEYILDKRFQVHGCAVQEGVDARGWWCEREDIQRYLDSLDPATTITFTYNALFDMCITEWIYGFDPFLMVDVLGMSRALRGYMFARHSLASVAKALGLPPKGDAIARVKGMRTAQIKADPTLWREFQEYAIRDNALCSAIYTEMAPEFPLSEMRVMDLVLRCAVQPQMRLNRRRLVMHRRKLRQHKVALMKAAHAGRIDLMSTKKFGELLTARGVEIEYKTSQTGRRIPAMAKTDEFMAGLLEHEDPDVGALAAARLGLKSTLEETRAARFAKLAKLPAACGYPAGSAPIALRYGAAHTGRLGGEWKLNFQNLTRGGELRYALEAHDGQEVLAPDFSQIEARMVAYLAKQANLLHMFDNKEDPYAALASKIFGFPVDKNIHKVERFIGKTGILGLGYGAGVSKFHTMVHQLARTQLGRDIDFNMEKASAAVGIYRHDMFPGIPSLWRALDNVIEELAAMPRNDVWHRVFPMLEFEHEAIILPNGMKLHYHDLKKNDVTGEWTYKYGRETRTIYGAKCLENISQALTRIIAMNAALRLKDRGLRMALQAHDELGFVRPYFDRDRSVRIITEEMLRAPSWAPGFPLGIEIKHGPTYGDAK